MLNLESQPLLAARPRGRGRSPTPFLRMLRGGKHTEITGEAIRRPTPLRRRRRAYCRLIVLCANAIILPKLNIMPKPIMFHRVGIGVIYSWVQLPSISVIAFNYDWYVSAHQSITNCHYVILLSLI